MTNQSGGYFTPNVALSFFGCATDVRSQNHVGNSAQRRLESRPVSFRLDREDVNSRTSEFFLLKRFGQSFNHNDVAAARIQKVGAWLHLRDFICAHHPLREGRGRDMKSDEIGFAEQVPEIWHGLRVPERELRLNVVEHHSHPHRFGHRRNLGADVPVTDDSQGLASDLKAAIALFVPDSLVQLDIALTDLTGQRDHIGNRHFCDASGIRERRIEYGHARALGRFQIDVIGSHTEAAHRHQVRASLENLRRNRGLGANSQHIDFRQFFDERFRRKRMFQSFHLEAPLQEQIAGDRVNVLNQKDPDFSGAGRMAHGFTLPRRRDILERFMAKILQPFGRYFLLDRIAQGGMADIFRARFGAPGTGGKILVIKCPQERFGQDPEALKLFEAEGNILLNLVHPNIVELQDFGEAEFQGGDGKPNKRPYLRMEFISGVPLRRLMTRATETEPPKLTPPAAVAIAIQSLRALQFAHERKDPATGKPLQIVHRDVNPKNLLLTWDGVVKLIDFGVAKSHIELTQPGIIKGTPAYLSPEQINATSEVDFHSDLFSLGIVLWEMLTGLRLFKAKTEQATLQKILQSDLHLTAPSVHNSSIPPILDRVVLQALCSQPADRHPSAQAMAEDLEWVLTQVEGWPDPDQEVRRILNVHFSALRAEGEKELAQLNAQAEALIQEGNARPLAVRTQSYSIPSLSLELEKPDAAPEVQTNPELPVKAETRPVTRTDVEASEPVIRMKTITKGPQDFRPKGPIPEQPYRGPRPKKAKGGSSWLVASFFVGALIWGVQSVGPTFGPVHSEPAPLAPTAPTPQVEVPVSAETPAIPVFKTVQLRINPPWSGSEIRLDGALISSASGAPTIELRGAQQVSITHRGYRTWQRTVNSNDLTTDADQTLILQIELEPENPGALQLATAQTGKATLFLESTPWEIPLPIQHLKLPAGSYQLSVQRALDTEPVRLRIKITPGRITKISDADLVAH